MFKYKIHNIKTDCNKEKEENSLVKINSFPFIKDEDKSFFYKCACLYKTGEYKNKINITNSIVEFLYDDNNKIEYKIIIFILSCSIIFFTIFCIICFNNPTSPKSFLFLLIPFICILSFFLFFFIISLFLSIKAKKGMKIYEKYEKYKNEINKEYIKDFSCLIKGK